MGAAVAGGKLPGHIGSLTKPIMASVKKCKHAEGDPVETVALENIRQMVKKIKASRPILSAWVKQEDLVVVGGFYDLDSGKVEIL